MTGRVPLWSFSYFAAIMESGWRPRSTHASSAESNVMTRIGNERRRDPRLAESIRRGPALAMLHSGHHESPEEAPGFVYSSGTARDIAIISNGRCRRDDGIRRADVHDHLAAMFLKSAEIRVVRVEQGRKTSAGDITLGSARQISLRFEILDLPTWPVEDEVAISLGSQSELARRVPVRVEDPLVPVAGLGGTGRSETEVEDPAPRPSGPDWMRFSVAACAGVRQPGASAPRQSNKRVSSRHCVGSAGNCPIARQATVAARPIERSLPAGIEFSGSDRRRCWIAAKVASCRVHRTGGEPAMIPSQSSG